MSDLLFLLFQPASKLVTSARSILPTVTDGSTSLQLSRSSQQLGSAVAELRAAAGRAKEACGAALEMQAALDSAQTIQSEVKAMAKGSQGIRALPGETVRSISSSQCKFVLLLLILI